VFPIYVGVPKNIYFIKAETFDSRKIECREGKYSARNIERGGNFSFCGDDVNVLASLCETIPSLRVKPGE